MKKAILIISACACQIVTACSSNSKQGTTDSSMVKGDSSKPDTATNLNDGTGAPGSGTGSAGRGTINDTTKTPQDTGSYDQPKPKK
jgi:hypothetical protein